MPAAPDPCYYCDCPGCPDCWTDDNDNGCDCRGITAHVDRGWQDDEGDQT